MNPKRWTALGIAVAILIISGVTQISRLFTNASQQEGPAFWEEFAMLGGLNEEVKEAGDRNERIVIINVNGAIMDAGGTFFSTPGVYNHQNFLRQLDIIAEDPTIKGVLLTVDSPGGGVFESAQIKSKLDFLQERVPLYVSMGAMAASGGYYIAAGADRIFAAPETITGSLGVIMQSFNVGGLMDEWGVSEQTIKSGEHKDIMSMFREMTEGEREILQQMIDNSYQAFVDIIAKGRGMSEAEVRQLADGRIYDGRQALDVNLIDGFGYLDDVISTMRTDLGLGHAEVFSYGEPGGFGSFFWSRLESFLPLNVPKERQLLEHLNTNQAPRLYYMWGA